MKRTSLKVLILMRPSWTALSERMLVYIYERLFSHAHEDRQFFNLARAFLA
jgi:hypothetical protein